MFEHTLMIGDYVSCRVRADKSWATDEMRLIGSQLSFDWRRSLGESREPREWAQVTGATTSTGFYVVKLEFFKRLTIVL